MVGLISGVLGARIYHVISMWNYYINTPLEMVKVWHGGLSFFGAFLGAAVGIYIYSRWKGIPLLAYIDIVAFTLPLSQSIGRIGNYINNELFGTPTTLPWKIYIPSNARPDIYKQNEYFHPLFAYEIIFNLILFGILNLLIKEDKIKIGTGKALGYYLIGYSLIRYFLEFLRTDSWLINGLNIAQMACVILFSCGLYIKNRRVV